MRIAFMGSPDFAVPALDALHAAGHQIAAVYCQPPKPAGRGQRMRGCPVHVRAEALGLPVRCPARLRGDAAAQAEFAALSLDVAVVAAYGLILPAAMLAAPRLGCWNIHASLLPRWRGAAPIQAAMLAGDAATGITIMQMDEGLDTGAMLSHATTPITADTTQTALHDRLAAIGARLIVRTLADPPAAIPQPVAGGTYAPKLTAADGLLDWRRDAAILARSIAALNPWPGTHCQWRGERLKILAATAEPGSPPTDATAPGTVLDAELRVACGSGALRIIRLQRAGRAALPAAEFLRGTPIAAGSLLT